MSFVQLMKSVLRNTSLAFVVFGFVTISMESMIPGFVSPYLDSIPFVFIGMIGLAIDSCGVREASKKKRVHFLWACSTAMLVVAFASIQFGVDHKIDLVAIGFVAAVIFMIALSAGTDGT
jgi:hypothetical protein